MTKEEMKKQAEEVKTKKDFDALMKDLNSMEHDYNSVVDACYAAMKGAFNLFNRGPKGGITGFQAGFVGWLAVADFMGAKKDSPLRLVDYDNMLYPQYADNFSQTIGASTWEYLQKTAKDNLANNPNASPKVIAHWESVVAGVVPFGYRVGE